MSGLRSPPPPGWGVGEGEGAAAGAAGGGEGELWAGRRMSGSLFRCLQEAGLWLDLRQHLCNRSCLFLKHIYGFPANYPDFLWGKFSARRLGIFTHITLLFLLIALIRVCPCFFFFSFFCAMAAKLYCSLGVIFYMESKW